jgi:hypothetical protein
MPKIEKLFTLEITPERFVAACSDIEIQELSMLVDREFTRRKIGQDVEPPKLMIDEEF